MPKATAEPPTEYDLPLINGYVKARVGGKNVYSKSQNNLVVVHFSIGRPNADVFPQIGSYDLAILPQGFRPQDTIATAGLYATTILNDSTPPSAGAFRVYILSNGILRYNTPHPNIKQLDGTFVFFAAT